MTFFLKRLSFRCDLFGPYLAPGCENAPRFSIAVGLRSKKTAKRGCNEKQQRNLGHDLELRWPTRIRIRQHSSSQTRCGPVSSHGMLMCTSEGATDHRTVTVFTAEPSEFAPAGRADLRRVKLVAMGGQIRNHQRICGESPKRGELFLIHLLGVIFSRVLFSNPLKVNWQAHCFGENW